MTKEYMTPESFSMEIHAEGILCESENKSEASNDNFGFDKDYDIL